MKLHLANARRANNFLLDEGLYGSWATNRSTTSPKQSGLSSDVGSATRTTLQGVRTEDNTAERCSGPRIACLQGIMDIRVDAFNWGWERDHAIQNHFVGLKSPLEQRYR